MRWATRAGVHIDRAACAWLIRRVVDAEVIAAMSPVLDGLYTYLHRSLLLGRDPA